MSASSASPFPFDFTCVRIPEDDSEECAEVTLTATQAGDLSKLLKQRFAGGAITNAEPLLASYGMDAVREKMDALTAVGAAGSVESRALVKPSSTTLPAPYSAVFMYYDELGALKGHGTNRRASELVARCGAGADLFPGDVYVGRFRTEPSPLRPVNFALAELAPESPWQLQAPEENAAYAEAMAAYTQAAEEKKVDSSQPLPAKPAAAGVGGASLEPEGEMHEVSVGAGRSPLQLEAVTPLPPCALVLCAHLAATAGRGGEWDPAGKVALELGACSGAVGLVLASLGARHVCLADAATDNLRVISRNAQRNLPAEGAPAGAGRANAAVSVAPLSWADGWQAASPTILARDFDLIVVGSDCASEAGVPLALLGLVLLKDTPAARLLLTVEVRPDDAAHAARLEQLRELVEAKCDLETVDLGRGRDGGALVEGWRCVATTTPDAAQPAIVEGGAGAGAARRPSAVAVHTYHSLVISPRTGELHSCGAQVDEEYDGGAFGLHMLGHGAAFGAAVLVPRPVAGLWGVRVREVAAGVAHSLLCTERGAVFSWGDGEHGKLGHSSASLASGGVLTEPLPIAALLSVRAKGIACGKDFSLVLSEAGEVHSFGDNRAGQLGRASATPSAPSDAAPALVQGLEGLRVRTVSGGATHALAVTEEGGAVANPEEDGALYSWGGGGAAAWSESPGRNTRRPLGPERRALEAWVLKRGCGTGACPRSPTPLAAFGHLGGEPRYLVLTTTSGHPGGGCLGHGDEVPQPLPRRLETLRGVHVRHCACGDEFSLAVDAAGGLWSWGCGDEGRLGLGDELGRCAPARVAALEGTTVRAASAGGDHALALTEAGEVYAFGCGEDGQLGLGDDEGNQLLPRRVTFVGGPEGRGPVVEAHAGFFYSAALTADGALHTWGHGEGGKLGHGDEEEQATPCLVGAMEGCLI